MRHPPTHRRGFAVAGAAIALTAASAVVLSDAQAQQRAGSDFTIDGEIDGLYPGLDSTLDAVVTNPQPVRLTVTAIEVSSSDAGPLCPASLLSFGAIVDSDSIAPGETEIVRIPVRVATETPDACQGASWSLEFAAQAVVQELDSDAGAGLPDGDAVAPPGSGDVPSHGALAFTGTTPRLTVLAGTALLIGGLLARRTTRRRP